MEGSRDRIINSIQLLAHRINIYILWRYISGYALFSGVIAGLIIIITKFAYFPFPMLPVTILILSLGIIVGIVKGLMARMSLMDTAVKADAELDLKDRLGSALELIQKPTGISAMGELQLDDAADHARLLDPKAMCPHAVPLSAKLLPVAVIALLILWLIPSPYGHPHGVSPAVRQAISQAGLEMQATSKEISGSLTSDDVRKMAEKMDDTGRKFQEDNLTKKESLRQLSNLVREVEALKMAGELDKELKGEINPEKERLLNEILSKLADSLKDLPQMQELYQKVTKAQQTDLSTESLTELAKALENMKITAGDMKALREMSDQLAKGKQDISNKIGVVARSPSVTGGIEIDSGKKVDSAIAGAPGKESASDSASETARRKAVDSQGYEAEIDGMTSEKGRIIKFEPVLKPEKGESVLSYEEIYLKYRQTADDAITRSPIPRIYRDRVKDYFDAIKPE